MMTDLSNTVVRRVCENPLELEVTDPNHTTLNTT
jgi:hypothetical protein